MRGEEIKFVVLKGERNIYVSVEVLKYIKIFNCFISFAKRFQGFVSA